MERNCIETRVIELPLVLKMKVRNVIFDMQAVPNIFGIERNLHIKKNSCTILTLSITYKWVGYLESILGTEIGISPETFKSELISLLPRLKRYAITLTHSTPDADDLVQDACMNALRKWEQYDALQPLDRWLFTILKNQWISEIRKRKVREGQGQIPAEDALELSTNNNIDDTILVKQVQGKISNLPSELSQPLLLVCAEGYSYLETSEFLEIPIGTVMSRIHRARKIISADFEGAY